MNESLVLATGIGIAFGATLEQAGLGDARKLIGQFRRTDFCVFRVMFSAILTTMLGLFWFGRFGLIDLATLYVPETWLLPQLVGGLVFGIGFVLAGLCPGTSCVAAASGRADGFAVMAGMFAGIGACGLAFGALEGFYVRGGLGVLTLPQWLGVPEGVVVFAIVAIALLAFSLLPRFERAR